MRNNLKQWTIKFTK